LRAGGNSLQTHQGTAKRESGERDSGEQESRERESGEQESRERESAGEGERRSGNGSDEFLVTFVGTSTSNMKIVPTILGAILLWFFHGCSQPDTVQPPPNIVLINVDDLGWADLGFMGSSYYSSPQIDALAAEGMVFTRAYASAANCAPSRACMMTGLNTPHHGIYTVGSSERGASRDRRMIPEKNTTTLHDSLTTLAEALQVFGYTTCHAGKWHLSDDPCDQGFDYNIGGGHNGHPRSYYPPYGNVELEGAGNKYLTDNIMDHVMDFLDTRQGNPFFLYYAPYAVHTPIHRVDSLVYLFKDKPGPPGMSHPEYATMIYNLDRNIGRLTAKLKAMGVYDQTLIIFTSDNGGLYRISQQKPLRAGKGSYYEGGIRVPTFFVWKGQIEPGANHEVPIVNLDFFPTLLDIIGAQLPGKQFDGISLAPLLLEQKQPAERPLFWHFPVYLEAGNADTRDSIFRTRPGSTVIFGNWKFMEYFEDGSVELFDLSEDPGERVNLEKSKSEKTRELQRMLEQWRKEQHAPVPSEPNPEFAGRQQVQGKNATEQ